MNERIKLAAEIVDGAIKIFCREVAAVYPLGCRIKFTHRCDIIAEVVRLPDYRDQNPYLVYVENIETKGRHTFDARYQQYERLGKK